MADPGADSKLSRLRKRIQEAARLQGTPHQLALAFALGILLGVLPGTGAAVAGVLALLFRLNVLLMVSGALLINPVTAPFLYIGSYFLGARLLGSRLPSALLPRIAAGTLAGNLVLALVLSILGYLVTYGIIRIHRARRHASGH